MISTPAAVVGSSMRSLGCRVVWEAAPNFIAQWNGAAALVRSGPSGALEART